jgi:hypothetical protein
LHSKPAYFRRVANIDSSRPSSQEDRQGWRQGQPVAGALNFGPWCFAFIFFWSARWVHDIGVTVSGHRLLFCVFGLYINSMMGMVMVMNENIL